MTECVALVVAAGRGERLGGDVPKQYQIVGGQPLLRHTVSRFVDHPRVDAIRVVIHPDDRPRYQSAVAGLPVLEPVAGGATRQESVCRGLESLTEGNPRHVLIHDAARPSVPGPLIDRVLDALGAHDGAVPGLQLTDTLKRAGSDGTILNTVDRSGLWRAQTPQGFAFQAILQAHRAAVGGPELTDDAAVAEAASLTVSLVEGDAGNVKVTTADDLERLVASPNSAPETRVGSGYDVHRFGPGDHVMLAGIVISHDRGLEGHSDADVVLHAATDAILGAVGAGDIGDHFPPSDPQWKGAASEVFLRHAASMVAAAGGRIVNLDVTVICERPRVGDYRTAMVENIASILGTDARRVSVKATTTERLGFTGRGEGIAAQATAAIAIPVNG